MLPNHSRASVVATRAFTHEGDSPLMQRPALFLATLAAVLLGPAVTEAATADLSYRKTTSVTEGKAVCVYNVRVQDAGGTNMTFTLLPAPENASGENGGEIRMLEPASASTGTEEACEAYPDTTATATAPVPDDDHTFTVVFQLHSHPDSSCSQAGLARGKVRMHVPNPARSRRDSSSATTMKTAETFGRSGSGGRAARRRGGSSDSGGRSSTTVPEPPLAR